MSIRAMSDEQVYLLCPVLDDGELGLPVAAYQSRKVAEAVAYRKPFRVVPLAVRDHDGYADGDAEAIEAMMSRDSYGPDDGPVHPGRWSAGGYR